MSGTLAQSTVQPNPNSVLAALKNAYDNVQPVRLSATALITFVKGSDAIDSSNDDSEQIIDSALLTAVWEHARRRAEDQTVLICSGSSSVSSWAGTSDPSHALSTLQAMINTFPNVPGHMIPVLTVLSAFLPVERSNIAVGAELSLSLTGQILMSRVRITDETISTAVFLKMISSTPVFTYLIASATPAEIESLSLHQNLSYYKILQSTADTSSLYLKGKGAEWRQALQECSLTGTSVLRGVFSILSGMILLLNDNEDDIIEGATLLGLNPEKVDPDGLIQSSVQRAEIVIDAYKTLLFIVVDLMNNYLATIDVVRDGNNSEDVCSVVSLIDAPSVYKALALKTVFSTESPVASLAAEMTNDGLIIPQIPVWISQTLQQDDKSRELVAPLVNVGTSASDIAHIVESESILSIPITTEKLIVENTLSSSRVWHILSFVVSDALNSGWSSAVVTSQIRNWFLPNWIQRCKAIDFTADFVLDEFADRYGRLLLTANVDLQIPGALENWAQIQRGWGPDSFFKGREHVWLREDVWRMLEGELDGLLLVEEQQISSQSQQQDVDYYNLPMQSGFDHGSLYNQASRENLLASRSVLNQYNTQSYSDEDLTMFGSKYAANDPETAGRHVEVRSVSRTRKIWVSFVWALTFWIPSFLLKYVGRMKRPDVRLAWREKLVICLIIFLMNAGLIFYMIFLGRVLCPDYYKVWDAEQVAEHTASNDFYVSIHGKVYDISTFWKLQHSDNGIDTTSYMKDFAGEDITVYFPPPLSQICPELVTSDDFWLTPNTTGPDSYALHTCGPIKQPLTTTALHNITWYKDIFLPKINEYFKGYLVVDKTTVYDFGMDGYNNWAIVNGDIYDLTDYFYSISLYGSDSSSNYNFLDSDITGLFSDYPGQDITDKLNSLQIPTETLTANMNCLKNAFFVGKIDIRESARCQVSNYILIAIACVLAAVILTKFFAALQFGSKRNPDVQDKFVICQIPAYTEGEDQLRNAIDSLTMLKYDNKRKLLFIICDGIVTGSGNDMPTPHIVLDILGCDPRIDPPSLAFKSVGEGSAQLNFGKVYSGLYEFEGNVVPYIVVVKCGKPTEKSKPGNRGKRDSQILLLDFLNKVHFQTPMSPLQLEIFHQINNVIGVDPELYEYVLMVDADTSVSDDSLNRLVACCVRDSRIAGIAGETSLQNEEGSWWTMIQVFEYYISHHLSKAFESLFGSVTCLPGCFCMYRLRTADKGRPLIISNKVIDDYADGQVDTLHKKNLLSLGEDRYLTTIMTKYFPRMKYVFVPDAYAKTAAPDSWSVLLSQRRRWINSTVHNLAELVFLPDLCGFCIFSMRFIVIVDLLGTLLLPSVVAYIGYLIYVIVTGYGPFPLISIVLIGGIYGVQALIFILKRQWQHVGWMIIYILAFPIYSLVLPVYSFWNQDNFSWGNTRIVVGERGDKQIVAVDDDGFDERDIPLQSWEAYAVANNLPGAKRPNIVPSNEKSSSSYMMPMNHPMQGDSYEMDDLRSVYSSYPPRPVSVFSNTPGKPYLNARPTTVMSNYPHTSGTPVGMPMYSNKRDSVISGYMGTTPSVYSPHQTYYNTYAPSMRPSSMRHDSLG
ncbi:chitin synthase-domain-containing protein [Dipodascopsis uninucleata]